MANSKLLDIFGTILLAAGFFLAFLPHAVHANIGLDDGTSHLMHVIIGMSLVIAGLAILVYSNKKHK